MSLFSVDLPHRFMFKDGQEEWTKAKQEELENYLNELSMSIEDMFRRMHAKSAGYADSPTEGNILKVDEDGGLVDSGETLDELAHLAGEETFTGEKTFSKFPIGPSEAPDADYELANKKYVDDEIDDIEIPEDTDEKCKMQESQEDAQYLEDLVDDKTIKADTTNNEIYTVSRTKVGTYTGDGNNTQAITGLGFQPELVWAMEFNDNNNRALKTSAMGEFSLIIGYEDEMWRDSIISLDSDGFTVGDASTGNANMNRSGQTYVYLAIKGE